MLPSTDSFAGSRDRTLRWYLATGWFRYSGETRIVKQVRSHIKTICPSKVTSTRSNGLARRVYCRAPSRSPANPTILSVAAVTPGLAGFLNLSLNKGVVISHRIWESEFSAKADVSGEQIRIGGVNLRVSGVAPEWLEGVYSDRAVDLWMPFKEEACQADRSSRNFWVLGRDAGLFDQ